MSGPYAELPHSRVTAESLEAAMRVQEAIYERVRRLVAARQALLAGRPVHSADGSWEVCPHTNGDGPVYVVCRHAGGGWSPLGHTVDVNSVEARLADLGGPDLADMAPAPEPEPEPAPEGDDSDPRPSP